jgi:hypothetical protein
MMGGGAFILLKVGQSWQKTAKQAEIRLAGLPTILSKLRSKRRNSPEILAVVVVAGRFHGIWIIRPKSFVLLPRSQSWPGNQGSVPQRRAVQS